MPGITGILSVNPKDHENDAISKMTRTMLHEPHYDTGTWVDRELGISVGWASHPNKHSKVLPYISESKQHTLIFIGENFSHQTATIASSPNYLLNLYAKGIDFFLRELNGTYCGIIIDHSKRTAFLFNDRYGLSRIYLSKSNEALYFGSEAKSILSVLPHTRSLDPQSLGELYSSGCTLQGRSLFTGIDLLPTASRVDYQAAKMAQIRGYFSPSEWEGNEQLSLSEYAEKTSAILDNTIPRYAASEQNVGMSLTGGVDSRMIMAAADLEQTPFSCYSFGGILRKSADARVAKLIADHFGLSYRLISIEKDFFDNFDSLAKETIYRTDGAMDVSGASGLYTNLRAREIAPIRMTGNYGGEILRGLIQLKTRPTNPLGISSDLKPYLRSAVDRYTEERDVIRASFVAFKQVPWHHFSRFALEQSILQIRTPFLDNELVKASYQAPPEARIDKSPAFNYIKDRDFVLSQIPTDRGIPANFTWLPLGVRRSLTELIPRAEYMFDYGMPNWLAKTNRFLSPLKIDRLFLGHQKYVHYRTWYASELSSFLKEILLDPQTRSRPYFDGEAIEIMVMRHIKGTENHTLKLHKLLTIELIERHLLSHYA